jgi:hypothetical protein
MARPSIVFGMVAVVLLGGLLLAQEKKPDDKKDPPTTTRVRGQLKPGWRQLGLSDEQKNAVYKVQTEYGAKIDALEAQIKELKQKQEQEEFKALTDAQKARLKEILTGKVPEDKKPEPPKSEEKKP